MLICCFRFAAAGPGEYFARGQHAEVAQAYCKGGRKMLVFAVLMDSSGLTARRAAPLPRLRPLPDLELLPLLFPLSLPLSSTCAPTVLTR